MKRRGSEMLKPLKVGDCVKIPVPNVDRGPATPRNVIGLILSEPSPGTFRIGTAAGTLKTCLSRSQMEKASETLLKGDVPAGAVSLRQAAASASVDGKVQGFLRCACVGQCKTNRCSCVASNVKCNSRCHQGHKCANVI